LDPTAGFLVTVSVTGASGAAVWNKNLAKAHLFLPSIDLPSSFAFSKGYFCSLGNTHFHRRWYHSKGSPLLLFLQLEPAGHSAESLYKSDLACVLIHDLICHLTPAHKMPHYLLHFLPLQLKGVLPDSKALLAITGCLCLKIFSFFMKDSVSRFCIGKLPIYATK